MTISVSHQQAAGEARRILDALHLTTDVVGRVQRNDDSYRRPVDLIKRDPGTAANSLNLTNSCDEDANAPRVLFQHNCRPENRVLRFPIVSQSKIAYVVKHSLISNVAQPLWKPTETVSLDLCCNRLRVAFWIQIGAYKTRSLESASHAGILRGGPRRGVPLPGGRHSGSGMSRGLGGRQGTHLNGRLRRGCSVYRTPGLAFQYSPVASAFARPLSVAGVGR